MRICVFGAGAIGGLLAARLAQSGSEVCVVARGEHLAAIRSQGLTLLRSGAGGEEPIRVRLPASDRAEDLGPQDAVIVALKAQGVASAAPAVAELAGPETPIVTAQNGIPWWYFYRAGGALADTRLQTVDPGGAIWRTLGPQRAVGCVVYPSGEIVEPGVVRHTDGSRFMLGEPDGSSSTRVRALAEALTKAGFRSPVRGRIRDDIWLKLWGNLAFNPISVVTGASLGEIGANAEWRDTARELMLEGQRVAEAAGARLRVDLERRLGWAVEVGDHKTSMLQDFESGRSLELDAVVGAVSEIGRLVAVETPTIDAMLVAVRDRVAQRDAASS